MVRGTMNISNLMLFLFFMLWSNMVRNELASIHFGWEIHIYYERRHAVLWRVRRALFMNEENSVYWSHIAGLNRRVPMGRSTQILGGSFRQGLNSEVVTFSTRLAFQFSPLYKSDGEKASLLSSDWSERLYSSNQVKLYDWSIHATHGEY